MPKAKNGIQLLKGVTKFTMINKPVLSSIDKNVTKITKKMGSNVSKLLSKNEARVRKVQNVLDECGKWEACVNKSLEEAAGPKKGPTGKGRKKHVPDIKVIYINSL